MSVAVVKKQFGFTLIELMIVVAVIGVLVTIALPVFREYTTKAKISAAQAGVSGEKIKVAENYSSGKGNYCLGTRPGTCVHDAIAPTLTGTYDGATVVLTAALSDTGVTWTCALSGAVGSYSDGDACP